VVWRTSFKKFNVAKMKGTRDPFRFDFLDVCELNVRSVRKRFHSNRSTSSIHIGRTVLAAVAVRRRSTMSRLIHILLLAIVPLMLAAPAAAAGPDNDHRDAVLLGDLWQTVLETPTPENPYGGGSPCLDLGSVVAPLNALALPSITCTVKPTESIFVAAFSSECSTFEAAPFGGEDKDDLRQCVSDVNAGLNAPTVTVDGQGVILSEVESNPMPIHLPKDNIFGLPPDQRKGFSVARGWVALLGRLTPGSHDIVITLSGTYLGQDVTGFTTTTTIIVTK
jgi:hypothetical protein